MTRGSFTHVTLCSVFLLGFLIASTLLLPFDRRLRTKIKPEHCIPGVVVNALGEQDASTLRVAIENHELWEKFHVHTNEMITAAKGRHMFPVLKV
jgi:hypothetical protein